MARVRVLAAKVGSDRVPVPRLVYTAQLYEDDKADPLWTCIHGHPSPIDAQACGVQHLNDLLYMRRRTGAA
jgi:hypothetical protein